MPVLNTNQLGAVGKAGEEAAADFLIKNNYTVLERNIKFGRLEIDIICTDGKYIIFTEVKTRSVRRYAGNSRFGPPSAAVTKEKQKKIITAAREYLKSGKHGLIPRFDVIEVWLNNGNPEFNHIKSAFIA